MLTDLSFLNSGQPWPPKCELERLERLDANKKLFEGKHDQVFTNWIRLLREDRKAVMELIFNWHKRLSLLWADLLLGEPPEPVADTPEQTEYLEELMERAGLHATAYEVAIDMSRYGEGIFKLRGKGREAIIEAIPARIWFPVVNRDNIKDILYHVLAWSYSEKVPSLFGTKESHYLKVEIHERGRITYRTYALKNGTTIDALLEESVEILPVEDFLVIPVSNLLTSDSAYGLDDYADLESIIQEMEVRMGQISKILDKHADPNMYGPDSALEIDPETNEYTFRAGGQYFPVGPDEKPPGYVTWEGNLEYAFKELESLIDQLYIVSETNPAAFGNFKDISVESGSALKRLLMVPLARVNRMRMRFDPGLKKVIKLANLLEIGLGRRDIPKISKLKIEWNDGLPIDDTEVSQVETQNLAAGISSRYSSLKRMYGLKGAALEEELERIKKDREEDVDAEVRKAVAATEASARARGLNNPENQGSKGSTGKPFRI